MNSKERIKHKLSQPIFSGNTKFEKWIEKNIEISHFIFRCITILLFAYTSTTLSRKYFWGLILLDSKQIVNLYSAIAQVLAALLGLLFTGYIFYRNMMNNEKQINSLYKKAFKEYNQDTYIDIYRTFLHGLVAILLSLLCIALNTNNGLCFDLLLNLSGISTLLTFWLIIKVVKDLLHPDNQRQYFEKRIKTINGDEKPKYPIQDYFITVHSISFFIEGIVIESEKDYPSATNIFDKAEYLIIIGSFTKKFQSKLENTSIIKAFYCCRELKKSQEECGIKQ